MGYGMIKVPKLIYATRSIKIRQNWAYFVVAECEDKKHKCMYNLEKYIFIIDKWEKDLQESPASYKEKEMLMEVRAHIDPKLYDELVVKSREDENEHKKHKLANRKVSKANLVKLNREVAAKAFEYKNSIFTREREMVMAIYYEEIDKAIKSGTFKIISEFDPYFERNWVFSNIPCLGKKSKI